MTFLRTPAMPPAPNGQTPAPTPERCLTLSNALDGHVLLVRNALLAAAGAAAGRGDEATGRELLDLADTASAYWQAWAADVHERIADVAFPHRRAMRAAPAPPATNETPPTPQPRPRRAKRKAKPQPEGAR